MSWYTKYRENYPIFSFVSLFLGIAVIMFAFFCMQVLRPMSMMQDRMNNVSVNWEEVKTRITKVNFGDSQERAVEIMGEPDEVLTSDNIIILSYQRYGMYRPVFRYDIEFRADTLYRVTTPNDFK